MKIVFMGTPEFAVPPLAALAARHDVLAVACRPDKPAGRGKKIQSPPVKEFASGLGIPVLQPLRCSDADFCKALERAGADVFVVAAFGLIFPKRALELPRYGCFNIHASLLPKYRGASPVQQAIIDGEAATGVTVMRMDEGLDTGDIVLRREIPIDPADTAGTLTAKLSALGAEAILVALGDIEAGRAVYIRQGADFTYAPAITKERGRLSFDGTPAEIVNLVRAMNPWPLCFAFINGERLTIRSAALPIPPAAVPLPASVPPPAASALAPAMIPDPRGQSGSAGDAGIDENAFGRIADISKAGVSVQARGGRVLLTEVQPGGGRAMPADAYTRGHGVKIGDRFSPR